MNRTTATDGYDSLTTVQQEILQVVADAGPLTGPALRDAFHRSDYVVYQNLPALVEGDLVASREADGRTNEYRLTEYGQQVLRDHATAVAEGVDSVSCRKEVSRRERPGPLDRAFGVPA